MNSSKKAVVLLSGGIDSATTVAFALNEGYTVYALSFKYGQRHTIELKCAKDLAIDFKCEEHKIISIDLSAIGGSSLTSQSICVPNFEASSSIPNTYVPARNTIMLSVALGWAEVLNATDIFIGANLIDYSGYPDCRPEYFQAFEKLAGLATKKGIEGINFKIHAPLINMKKAEIIRLGVGLGVDYSMTISCYNPSIEGYACGLCDSCHFRKNGFIEAQVDDPTIYQSFVTS